MNKDRGSIDQGSGSTLGRSGSGGSGSYDFSQPAWGVQKQAIVDQLANLDNFVVIGTKDNQPFVAGTTDKMQAQQLLQHNAPSDLIRQNA